MGIDEIGLAASLAKPAQPIPAPAIKYPAKPNVKEKALNISGARRLPHRPATSAQLRGGKGPGGGDKPVDNDENWRNLRCMDLGELGSVIRLRKSVLLMAAITACAVLQPSRAPAQWWSRAPADFEECADAAEKAATKEARTSGLSECNAKFAGRRKPGGGYSYFDFMQNRSFDIAGPNPTQQEQKHIDEQYTAYLDRQRRSTIAAAFTAKQQQLLLQQANFRSEPERTAPPRPPRKPAARANDLKPAAAPADLRPRAKPTTCDKDSFSCEWPRLSESIKDWKKRLFGAPPSTTKAKRS
jgi:hypothetical protein